MEQQPSPIKENEGATNGDDYAEYATTAYEPVPFSSVLPSADGGPSLTASQGAPTWPSAPPVSALEQAQQLLKQQELLNQKQLFQALWADQMDEIEQTADFKSPSLPLARIKKIMKADDDVKMIAGEAPVVFAKACEMFILELTMRAWRQIGGTKRRTLQRSDVVAAIAKTDIFDFLIDIIPETLNGDCVVGMPPTTTLSTMMPSYIPGMTDPFGMYANQQPVSYAWPDPQQEQQTSDGERDE